MQTARTIAVQRFQGIKKSILAGDKPAIDTLEAWILVRTRDAEIIDASQFSFEAAQKMSVFVWSTDLQPLEPENSLVPATAQLLDKNTSLPLATSTLE